MSVTQKEIKGYLNSIKSSLVCSKKEKTEFLSDFEASIANFVEEEGNDSMEAVYAHFGTPEEIAKAYLGYTDPVYVKKAVGVRKTLLAAVLSIVMLFAFAMSIIIADNHSKKVAYFIEGKATEVEIVDNSVSNEVQ